MADGFGNVLRRVCRILMMIFFGIAGYQLASLFVPYIPAPVSESVRAWFPAWLAKQVFYTFACVGIFALIGWAITPLLLKGLGFIGALLEYHLKTLSWQDISSATLGLIVGLLIANLIAVPFSDLPVGNYIAIVLNIVLGYLGARIFWKRQQDIRGVFNLGALKERLATRKTKKGRAIHEDIEGEEDLCPPRKILDTSVIIDGRILDIARTGFMEGVLVLPRFVLLELQAVADSTDPARRTRGRRGLDVVNELQKLSSLDVEIMEVTLKQLKVETVDSGLVALAQQIGGEILTTDYNLNKIAQIQGITVLNVNDLANAMKPMLLPGESIIVDVIREGKEPHQGVGYLDDGTMLVVEDGENYIGKRVEVVVTSMLQTSAGRMVFGRIRREVRP
ncbi:MULTISPECIES: PIN/TRAM domain-containing protein [Aminobacterium]|uniref:PIN/TRAM domain-containing protein n=1 Tax=Aminobacterium TaxID=81466 RepID=UPI00257F2DFD|nr:PIN domain-containing protein [Aminobacterium sp. UBA4834]